METENLPPIDWIAVSLQWVFLFALLTVLLFPLLGSEIWL